MNDLIFNKYQSSLEELKIEDYPQEVQEQFFDCINNIPYIKSLISPTRLRAKDLPKDSDGKIIVDLTKPHILEDMDYFRPSAIHYQTYGVYTKLRPNPNPNSEYGKWIREEIKRCYEGYVRESDGEWITGDMYFFLNYCPIPQTRMIKGSKKGERVIDFPEFWEGIYYRFHYIHQAQYGGISDVEGGKNGCEISSRGKSKSLTMAAIMAKRFVLGENKDVNKEVKCMATAYQKQYLTSDGILNKFQSYIDFLAQNTQFPSRRLKSSIQDMQWRMGYVDLDTGTSKGTLNEVIGVSSKDDPSKIRGKRLHFIVVEEFGCHIKGTKVMMSDGSTKCVEDVRVGDKLMGDDGTPRTVKYTHGGVDMLYKITLSNGDTQIVNSKHLIYYKRFDWNKKEYKELLQTPEQVMAYKSLDKGNYILKSDKIQFEEKPLPIDPYWVGLWLGDGDKTRMCVANEDIEVLDYLEKYASDNKWEYYKRFCPQSRACYEITYSTKNNIFGEFRNLNLVNNKHIPQCYKYNSRENMLQLIAGLVDTDGNLNQKKKFFEITQRWDRKHILDDVKFMCESMGFKCSLTSRLSNGKKPGVLHYRLRISGNIENIPTKISRKQYVRELAPRTKRNWNEYTFKVEPYGIGEYYGFEVDGNHLFLLDDFTIVHNSFKNVLETYNVMLPSVQEGNISFGTIYMIGTAGDSQSDFAGAQEIVYNPKGYNMYPLKNVFDKEGQGKSQITFFFPGYINRKGCYDKDGNSDVTKAILEILVDRYRVKYNSSDINSVTKAIAEIPITPQEAIIRVRGNVFPISQINERLNQLDNNPSEYNDVYVGNLVQNKNGKIEFVPTSDIPIRDFPTKDNHVSGAIEIFEMPIEVQGKIPYDRYIMSLDNFENDYSETMSLGSMFVLDLWTDRIVAEYTGRPEFSDDLNEIARKMALFYNAKILYENNKKNTFAYFSKMNSLHLLADTPEYLKQRQLIKTTGYGNSSKGVSATVPIKNFGFTLIRDWLLKPVVTTVTENDVEMEVTVPNLFFIRNRALLKELLLFNPDINVDRIMSLVQLMLFREEKMVLYGGDPKKKQEVPSNYLGNDPFFTNNYDNRRLYK